MTCDKLFYSRKVGRRKKKKKKNHGGSGQKVKEIKKYENKILETENKQVNES